MDDLLAPASTEDRWVGEAFFCWRDHGENRPVAPQELPRRGNGRRQIGPTGPLWPRGRGLPAARTILADNGFFGA